MKKHSQRGSVHLPIIIGIIIVIIGALGFIFWKQVSTQLDTNPANGACKTEENIRLCIKSSFADMASSDTATITTTITNVSLSDIKRTFSCTFTDPSVYANDRNINGLVACGQAITYKTISAGKTETFTKKISGSQLKVGANTLRSKWSGYTSGDITITKKAVTDGEISKQFSSCQSLADSVSEQNVPDVCGSISVYLGSSTAKYDCKAWKTLLGRIDLAIPCSNYMENSATVYVPRETIDAWIMKVEALPEVDSAFAN